MDNYGTPCRFCPVRRGLTKPAAYPSACVPPSLGDATIVCTHHMMRGADGGRRYEHHRRVGADEAVGAQLQRRAVVRRHSQTARGRQYGQTYRAVPQETATGHTDGTRSVNRRNTLSIIIVKCCMQYLVLHFMH